MSVRIRGALLAFVLGTLVIPVITAHSLVNHLSGVSSGVDLRAFAHPESVLLLVLTAIAALPALRFGVAINRARRAAASLRAVAKAGAVRHLHGVPYLCVPEERVSLFAAGFFRPRIYVTSGAIASLDAAFLRAGVLHEQAHVRGQHPRWLAVNALLRYAYGPLPGAHRFFEAVQLECERQADWSAIAAGARRADLFEAIVRAAAPDGSAPGLGAGHVEQRLRWIADGYGPPQHLPLGAVAGAMLGLSVLPLTAHLLLWMGLITGASFHHTL